MFDFSFFELLVIGVVALIVIGPERLPGAIRTGALWLGRLKRTLTETRSEIEKHIGADEIRRQLHNEQVLASLEKLKESRAALERDLLDYQNKLNEEAARGEVIEQPREVTYDHTIEDDYHKQDASLDHTAQTETAAGVEPNIHRPHEPKPSTPHEPPAQPDAHH